MGEEELAGELSQDRQDQTPEQREDAAQDRELQREPKALEQGVDVLADDPASK